VLEASLHDDVRAGAHRALGVVERGRAVPVDRDDALADAGEVRNVGALVLETALAKELEHRVVEVRAARALVGGEALEGREVATGEEVGEVGGEEKGGAGAGGEVHGSSGSGDQLRE
jgi:hypothetical protein